jgi:hypothetical protein
MTHDEMIAVIQAHKEGKTIQCRCSLEYGGPHWQDCVDPKFNFAHGNYRVKPEPREVVGWTHPDLFSGGCCEIYPRKGIGPQVKVRVTEVF